MLVESEVAITIVKQNIIECLFVCYCRSGSMIGVVGCGLWMQVVPCSLMCIGSGSKFATTGTRRFSSAVVLEHHVCIVSAGGTLGVASVFRVGFEMGQFGTQRPGPLRHAAGSMIPGVVCSVGMPLPNPVWSARNRQPRLRTPVPNSKLTAVVELGTRVYGANCEHRKCGK